MILARCIITIVLLQSQESPDKEAACGRPQAEPTSAQLDQNEDGQHYPIQRQEETLEAHQAGHLSSLLSL